VRTTIQREHVPLYDKLMAGIERYAEVAAVEVFKWLGWATAIAAIRVVDQRTHSSWLWMLPIVLSFFVAARIQWLFGIRGPEVREPDGSITVRISPWRTLLMMLVPWAITLLLAFGIASQIASSDLLPDMGQQGVSQPAEQAGLPRSDGMEVDLGGLFGWLGENESVASALATMAGALTALLALFVSVVSLAVACWTAHVQRRHNKLTVRPLPEVTVADFENLVRVKLRNHGSGPLLIRSFRVAGFNGNQETLVDAVPALPGRPWTNFSGKIDGRALLPGSEIVLLELVEDKGELGFRGHRDLARKALALATITLEYSDVYESSFEAYSKSLQWFGRHWGSE